MSVADTLDDDDRGEGRCELPLSSQRSIQLIAAGFDYVILMATTVAHLAFAQNIVKSLTGHPHVIMTPDSQMLEACKQKGWSSFCVPAPAETIALTTPSSPSSPLAQHSPLYNRFTWARIRYIECVVQLGITVWFLDTDAVVTKLGMPAVPLLDPAWDLSISCDNIAGPQTNPALSVWRPSAGSRWLLRYGLCVSVPPHPSMYHDPFTKFIPVFLRT